MLNLLFIYLFIYLLLDLPLLKYKSGWFIIGVHIYLVI
jgi:hypothetical protein